MSMFNVNINEDEPDNLLYFVMPESQKRFGKQLLAPPKSMEFFVNSDLSDKDTTLSALPFSHLGGLIYIQNTICFSLRLILMERFIPLEFLRNIIKYKVSFFWIVPSMYYAFLQLKEFETFDLSSYVGG